MKYSKPARPGFWIILPLLFVVFLPGGIVAMDSTNVTGTVEIPVPPGLSILGNVENNKLCKFKSIDSKIHCQSNQGGIVEYRVDETIYPILPRFQSRKIGNIIVENDKIYGFTSPISHQWESQDTSVCKLALEFVETGQHAIWIWYDEIRFDGAEHRAHIDTDGDGFIDRILTGNWNGNLYGSKKWWTPDPFDGKYTTEEREYTHRPVFERINGRVRGCGIANVKVVSLTPIN